METRPPIEEQPPASEPIQIAPRPAIVLLSAPGLEPDDPMSEAGRKVLRFHYRRMLYNEPGTRLGRDIEALHDMRVATRRMRSAFRVFGDYYQPKTIVGYIKGLKRTGRALGPVRDLDVFRVKIQAYVSSLPEPEQDSLDEFLALLERRREAARDRSREAPVVDGLAPPTRRLRRLSAGRPPTVSAARAAVPGWRTARSVGRAGARTRRRTCPSQCPQRNNVRLDWRQIPRPSGWAPGHNPKSLTCGRPDRQIVRRQLSLE